MPNFDFLKDEAEEGESPRTNTSVGLPTGAPPQTSPPSTESGQAPATYGCLAVIAIAVIVGIGGQVLKSNWRQVDHSADALRTAQRLVKENLRAPASAKFPRAVFDDAIGHVDRKGQSYRINSFVDCQNGFGAVIRLRYSVKLTRTGPDYADFRLDELQMFEP